MRIIKGARKILVNTPVNDWIIAGVVREWIYKFTNKGGIVEVEYLTIKLRLPGHDFGLAPGLLGGYYEKLQLTIYAELAKKADVIIDVGANIGLYSSIGAKNLKKSSKLIAFEPIPDNIDLLKSNLQLNGLQDKVTIVPKALGEDDRKLELYLSSKSIGNHSAGGSGARGYGDVLEVDQTTIDAYTNKAKLKTVDLIKIDVEGYDGYVLKGGLKTIAKYHPALMIECIPELLDRCNFDYRTFGEMLFKNYKHRYVIDEANSKIEKITAKTVDDFLEKIKNTNLLLVQHEHHKKIIDNLL
ncbi:MAG TPA: FkbM family methyltransferase [Candidatus Saccharimonadales bacterium]|nr:FkbM family methyltransferase [Candidatus Saccharimonadales bacterium]